ncbi:hypothetical protein [Rhodococcus ruber]
MVLTERAALRQLDAARDELRVARRTQRTLVAISAASVVVGFVGVFLTYVTGNVGFAAGFTTTFWVVAVVATVCSFTYSECNLKPARAGLRRAEAAYEDAVLEGGRP